MKSTDCNANMVWPQVGFPKHRRSARRAKMQPNLSPLLPVADIDVGRSFGANMFLLEKGTHAEHRTGPPLTLATMADADGIGIGGYLDTQGTTRAMRGSRHSTPPSAGAVKLQEGFSWSDPFTAGRARCPEFATAHPMRTRQSGGGVRLRLPNLSEKATFSNSPEDRDYRENKMPKSPVDTLMEISMGFTLCRSLHVIAELGVADALGETPLSADALAAATGTHPDALNRALRVLSAHGVFAAQNSLYAHTPASHLLRSDHPQSMRSFVRMQGIPALWHIWEDFDHALRTGRSAAEKSMPNGFWGYLTENPEHSRLFNEAMTGLTHAQVAGILSAYDFSGFKTIADIGGGNGYLLRAVLATNPNAQGVLFDLPHVVEQAKTVPSERLTFQAGSFFEDSLPSCEAYLMKVIIHDWSDKEAAEILKAVRRSAPQHAKLLLAEFMIPEDSSPNWTLFVDLIMLGELTGKERTQTEFAKLLDESGFKLDRIIDTGSNTYLLESSAV
jgi:hypothetical protein